MQWKVDKVISFLRLSHKEGCAFSGVEASSSHLCCMYVSALETTPVQ